MKRATTRCLTLNRSGIASRPDRPPVLDPWTSYPRLLLGAIVLAALLLAAGCSGAARAAPPVWGDRPAPQAPPTYAVRITDTFRFEPSTLTVPRGSTVVWTNAGQMVHTVTGDPARAVERAHAARPPGVQPWDSGDIAPGAAFSHTFTAPGRYVYFCAPHEVLGQVATIVVTE